LSIAAVGNNAKGIVGVDRRAKILPVRAIKIKAGPSGIIEKHIRSISVIRPFVVP
jgi:hypothetical protein